MIELKDLYAQRIGILGKRVENYQAQITEKETIISAQSEVITLKDFQLLNFQKIADLDKSEIQRIDLRLKQEIRRKRVAKVITVATLVSAVTLIILK